MQETYNLKMSPVGSSLMFKIVDDVIVKIYNELVPWAKDIAGRISGNANGISC